MADRKAINKYYPPDWDPSKSGSINKYNKSHPLRHRAKKIDQGILVVRFELPFNIWCLKCDNHIAMGVRYNAEKTKVGNYYSTPIHKFRMKCHLCDNYFEIQTDPAKFDYTILKGARKQIIQSEESLDNLNELATYDNNGSKAKITDAMFRLEKKIEDKLQSDAQLESLKSIKESSSRWIDSFAANQVLRNIARERRKKVEVQREKDKRLLKKSSLNIKLKKSKLEDKVLAKQLYIKSIDQKLNKSEELAKKNILDSKIIVKSNKNESKKFKQNSSSYETRSNSRTKHTYKFVQNHKIKKEPE